MTIVPEFNNGHSAIRFKVSFMTSNGHDGAVFDYVSHAETKEAAIVGCLKEYLETDRSKDMPLVGISVYQCIFTC